MESKPAQPACQLGYFGHQCPTWGGHSAMDTAALLGCLAGILATIPIQSECSAHHSVSSWVLREEHTGIVQDVLEISSLRF